MRKFCTDMGGTVLNNRYFQDLLRRNLKDESITVLSCTKKEACEKGSNFMASVKQFLINGCRTLQGTRSDYSVSLIVKQLPENAAYCEKYQVDKAFSNEVIAYNTILPTLNAFSSEKFSFPKCLTANENVIIIEDLRTDGFNKIEKGVRLPSELIKIVLKELAKLHSASIVMKMREPENFEDMTKNLCECVYCKDRTSPLLQTQDVNIDVALKLFESYEKNDINQKALETLSWLKGKTAQLLTKMIWKTRKFSVLTHGDIWSSNIFFRGNDVKLIDFQTMRVTSVAADLSYLFYVNMKLETLKKHLHDLLQFYLKCLHGFLKSSDINLENDLTMEWLKNEMEEFELFGFMCAIWLLPLFHWKQEDLTFSNKNVQQNNSLESVFSKMSVQHKLELTEYVLNYINKK